MKIAVCGAGTMGSGIAQIAAQSGFDTILFDLDIAAIDKARERIKSNLNYLVAKNKFTETEAEATFSSIRFITTLEECKADIIIEAIIENTEAKTSLFNRIAEVNDKSAIFATNTSSLSVSDLQKNIIAPERVVGMHFFNPAQVMKLVEVVKAADTNDEVVKTIYDLCVKLGKTPVICKDAPGFIVNRVARPYYLEAMKLVEQGVVAFKDVDELMESSGFKMGPFKLMDLIGMDINLAVSESIYKAFNKTERFKPSDIQREKVRNGELGKKTAKGFYQY